ncbi:MAG TPA: DUF5678 domain-containing protein [Candidatus Binatia bacterium]|nr:DUF5678 domain-containing protein [Candidatus Binatia bacterium]
MATSKKPKESEPREESLVAEERAFYKRRSRLLKRYEGQFVALYRGRVVGHGPSDEELARQMFEKFGDAPFFIQRVEKEPTIYEVPSPEVVR